MIELPSEYKPFFFVAATMLGVEIVYFLNMADDPKSGWEVYLALLALSASVPLLSGACLAAMVGYSEQMKHLLWGGLILGAVWFFLALLALSVLAALIAAFVSAVSYKMLQYHYRDKKDTKSP